MTSTPDPSGAPSTPDPWAGESQALFADHAKVYPRAVSGLFRRLKWTALVLLLGFYYLAPWLRWDRGPGVPDQAILFDLDGRRFYLFALELWPQQIYYLTGLLVFCAVALFLATTLAGRLWCGYACPQTVWTDLFLWVERRIEGDRSQRQRLDRAPWSRNKLWRKLAKHSLWLLIALATGGAWVFYFVDAPTLVHQMLRLETPETTLWCIALLTATTYTLAGMAREQVCIYMCPWPRFQAAMQDEDSLIVTYQAWRGEQRGPGRKSVPWAERLAAGGGDCIDCGQCHQVCPTGIDIRDGNQLACIGCGLCIDACNGIMERIGRPRGLVTFDTETNQVAKAAGQTPPRWRLLRPRTVIYSVMLLALGGAMGAGLAFTPPVELSVMHERAPLWVATGDGGIRNGYTLKITNMSHQPRQLRLELAGVEGALLTVAGSGGARQGTTVDLSAGPDSVAEYRVFVKAPLVSLGGSSQALSFILSEADGERVTYQSVLLGPERKGSDKRI